jgi:hypothetical protein
MSVSKNRLSPFESSSSSFSFSDFCGRFEDEDDDENEEEMQALYFQTAPNIRPSAFIFSCSQPRFQRPASIL